MQTIKPATNQIFAKPTEEETKTVSGILLSKALERPVTASVINVGDKVTQYSRDDLIVYKQYATTEIKLNGETYFVINEDDVLGKVVEVES